MSFEKKRRPNRSTNHQTPLKILFTKVDPVISKPFAQIIQKLGGCSIETPQIGDVLICDKVYRTFKFLFALCKGIPIVRSKWLEVSNKNGAFEPTEPYLLIDYDAEKRFNFTLKESIGRWLQYVIMNWLSMIRFVFLDKLINTKILYSTFNS